MENKDYFDLSFDIAKSIPPNADIERIARAFSQIESLVLETKFHENKIRDRFMQDMVITKMRIAKKRQVSTIEEWESSMQLLLFAYQTIRHWAYEMRDEQLLENVGEILLAKMSIYNDQLRSYVQNEITDRLIAHKTAETNEILAASAIAIKTLGPKDSKIRSKRKSK